MYSEVVNLALQSQSFRLGCVRIAIPTMVTQILASSNGSPENDCHRTVLVLLGILLSTSGLHAAPARPWHPGRACARESGPGPAGLLDPGAEQRLTRPGQSWKVPHCTVSAAAEVLAVGSDAKSTCKAGLMPSARGPASHSPASARGSFEGHSADASPGHFGGP